MMKIRTIIIIGLLVLAALAVVRLLAPEKQHAEVVSEASTKTQLTQEQESELLDAEGKALNFDAFEGKVVFINNWASWCPPCIAEMPTILELKKEFEDEDLAFVMVSFDQSPDKALRWMDQREMDLPVYFPASKFPREYVTDAIPATFILDREGKLLHRQMGMADYSSPAFRQQMKTWLQP